MPPRQEMSPGCHPGWHPGLSRDGGGPGGSAPCEQPPAGALQPTSSLPNSRTNARGSLRGEIKLTQALCCAVVPAARPSAARAGVIRDQPGRRCPSGAQTGLNAAGRRELSAVPKAWPTLRGSTPVGDCDAGWVAAGANPPGAGSQAAGWERSPSRQGGRGSGDLLGGLQPQTQLLSHMKLGCGSWKLLGWAAAVRAVGGFESPHVICAAEAPEHRRDPRGPPGQQDSSWET